MMENIDPSIQERSVRAFLDLVILRMLLHQPMTAYEIDNLIMKKFGGKRSPNVVYTKLANMERRNLISYVNSKYGRVYNITAKGKKITENMAKIIEDIQSFVLFLLGS